MVVKSFIVFTIVMFVGGAIFMHLEHDYAKESLSPQKEMALAKSSIMQRYNLTRKEVEEVFMRLEEAIHQNGVKEPYTWNYYESCFFVGSLLTTIGYGHIAPKTIQGQTFAIFFGLFGIPLTVLVVRNLSKRITDVVLYIVRFIYAASSHLENQSGHLDQEQCSGERCRRINAKRRLNGKKKANCFSTSDRKTKIACIVVLFLMVLSFLIISSVMRIISEGWTMQQSLYFWFITLTTVGLGDYVPYDGRKPTTMAATIVYYSGTFYLMFGLALIASLIQCISVLWEGRLPAVTNEVHPVMSVNHTEVTNMSVELHRNKNIERMQNKPELEELFTVERGRRSLPEANVAKAVIRSSSRLFSICIPERSIVNLSTRAEKNEEECFF